jgi:hypothetical protein
MGSPLDPHLDGLARIKLPNEQEQPYTIITHRKRTIEMYYVLRQELDDLISGYTSVHLGFFGITLGATLTLFVTCTTVPLGEPWKSRYWSVFILSAFATVYCGSMAIREWLRARTKINHIKAETVSERVQFVSGEK